MGVPKQIPPGAYVDSTTITGQGSIDRPFTAVASGGGGGSTTAFQYVVVGTEPDLANLVIALPVARSSTNYGVVFAMEQFTALLTGGIATASKTTTQFVLSLSAAAQAGDVFTFIVQDL